MVKVVKRSTISCRLIYIHTQGKTAPKWMVKIETQYRARFKNKRRKRKKKKKDEDVHEENAIPTVPIPDTVSGMVLQAATEAVAGYTGGMRSRVEYRRRIRQMEGPGPLERALLDYLIVPLTLALIEIYLHLSAYWRVNEGFARKKVKDDDDDDDDEIRKIATWHELEMMQHRIQTMAALGSFVSVATAVLVNELQFRGYIPAWEQDCSNPDALKLGCKLNPTCNYAFDDLEQRTLLTCAEPEVNNFGFVDRLKFFNTGLTLYIMFTAFFYFRYEANIFSIRNHTEFVDPKLRSYWLHECGLLKWYMLEILFLIPHQVPYFYYDVIVQTSYFGTRPSVYSVDGIVALVMGVRFWQVWKWYRGFLYTRFTSRRYAIRLNDEETGSLLAVRLFVLANPVFASTHLFLAIIFLGSFVYRIAESSVNEIVGVYYWDAMWFMIDAMTGLPIADKTLEPQGTFGRVIAVIVRFLGIFWFVLVVTAVKQFQKYDESETQFFGWIRISSLNTIVKVCICAHRVRALVMGGFDQCIVARECMRIVQ